MGKPKKNSAVAKPRIKKGDTVLVRAGKDRGKSGEVIRVLPREGRVVVQGLNIAKRHTRPSEKNPHGGRVDKPMPIAISNLMVVAKDNKAGRVGVKRVEAGEGKTRPVRYLKKTGQEID